jgi:hypothetical protein
MNDQHPALIAAPRLQLAFELRAAVAKPIEIGRTAVGRRRIIPILSGTFEGSGIQAHILTGGADYQILHDDGFTEIEARYVLETDTGETIYVINRGMRHGPPDVMAKLNAGLPVDPSQVYFRTVPYFETASPALQWIVRTLFVCVGERSPDGVQIRFYRVE